MNNKSVIDAVIMGALCLLGALIAIYEKNWSTLCWIMTTLVWVARATYKV